MDEQRFYTGSHGEYFWLTSTEDYSGTLLRVCPEIVVDRYLAVTSVDSGTLRLTEGDVAGGWRTERGVGYSPKIRSSEEVPHQYDGPGCCGYDEFYIYTSPCDVGARTQGNIFLEELLPAAGRVVPFVNWPAFALYDADAVALVALFWPQLERLKPESYVADGFQCLTLSVAGNRWWSAFTNGWRPATGNECRVRVLE